MFNIYDIDINKILIAKKEPYGKKCSFKCFIESNDNKNFMYKAYSNDWLKTLIVIRQCL